MVVRLNLGRSIQGALSYNELKLKTGKAELLLASGFSCDINRLGFTEKLTRFQLLNSRREKVKTNTLHLSLNFPPGEELSDHKLRAIAYDYMNRIGFGEQPFLVYKHKDAHHPHIHIVTNTIRSDGLPIQLHKITDRLSEPARKWIEQQYGLTQAQGRKTENLDQSVNDLIPAEYGKVELKNHLTNTIGQVARAYKFSNFDEFNRILRQFNIIADRGKVDSLRFKKRGIVYSFLDSEGNKIGVPIKASDIYKDVTLDKLEERYQRNLTAKDKSKEVVKDKIEKALKYTKTIDAFFQDLIGKKIRMGMNVLKEGQSVEVYFVDHISRKTFTQKELGIDLEQLIQRMNQVQAAFRKKPITSPPKIWKIIQSVHDRIYEELLGNTRGRLLSLLFSSTQGGYGPTIDIPKKKKKKKRPS